MQNNISIKIIGVGGGGINSVSVLVDEVQNAVCIAMDTDEAALMSAKSHEKILLGKSVTRSSSAGGDTKLAAKVLHSDIDTIKNLVNATDIVFISSSLGGATGSVIAPAVAKIAKESGAIVISFSTLAFKFEGTQKEKISDSAMNELSQICDMAIALPNDAMLHSCQSNLKEALGNANRCVVSSISSICKMLDKTGLINIDFGALKNLFKEKVLCPSLFTYAHCSSENKASDVISELKKFPSFQTRYSATKASKLIVCLSCASDTSMQDFKSILASIAENFSDSTEVLFGAILDESYKGSIEVFAMGLALNAELSNNISDAKLELPSKMQILKTESQLRRERVSKTLPEKENQSEFEFVDIELKRGFFEGTEPNLYGKEDLDVPTFIRRKIKIALKKI